MNRKELEQYIAEIYGVQADFPWVAEPDYAVYRHKNNQKWFALFMTVPKTKLGVKQDGLLDIVNVKCDPIMIGSFREEPGIYPAYHMSKATWLSVALDGSANDEKIKLLLDISFGLTARKVKSKRN